MITYDIVIDHISDPFGEYPGTVEVRYHLEGPDFTRDGFATDRVALPSEAVNADGAYNDEEIYKVVRAAIGDMENFEQ